MENIPPGMLTNIIRPAQPGECHGHHARQRKAADTPAQESTIARHSPPARFARIQQNPGNQKTGEGEKEKQPDLKGKHPPPFFGSPVMPHHPQHGQSPPAVNLSLPPVDPGFVVICRVKPLNTHQQLRSDKNQPISPRSSKPSIREPRVSMPVMRRLAAGCERISRRRIRLRPPDWAS